LNAKAFFVTGDGRPHPPWRLLYFLGLSAVCVVVATLVLGPFWGPLHQITGIGGTGAAYSATVGLLLAHWMTFETFDKQGDWSFVWMGRDAARSRPLLAGLALGALPIGVASLVLLGAGLMAIESAPPGSWVASAARVAIILVPAAFYEELLMRGYAFATLREWLGSTWAVAITSVAFGLLHAANPGTSYVPLFVVALAGAYLAIVMLATRSLYAVWVAHLAWNFVQAAALHVPVSGLPMTRPNYQIVETGPDWITGGDWGPEGGVAAASAMLVVVALLYSKRLLAFGSWKPEPTAKSQEPTTK
jgi:membrane protease YdiL (CAAX protease family)